MVNKILKIMSILVLIAGLLLIMIIKNISVQKKNYLEQLKVELKEEENKNQLFKIQWEYLVSPVNLKKISTMKRRRNQRGSVDF